MPVAVGKEGNNHHRQDHIPPASECPHWCFQMEASIRHSLKQEQVCSFKPSTSPASHYHPCNCIEHGSWEAQEQEALAPGSSCLLYHSKPDKLWGQVFKYTGLAKSPLFFFCKIKDTFFIFTNDFIGLDSLSMSAFSRYWLLVGRGQGCC